MDRVKSMKHAIDAARCVAQETFVVCFCVHEVLFTSIFKHLCRAGITTDDYFSRFDLTALTLFQTMHNDDWSDVAREFMKSYTWSAYLLILFLVHVSFVLLNVFTAMFVRGTFLMGERNFDEETQIRWR